MNRQPNVALRHSITTINSFSTNASIQKKQFGRYKQNKDRKQSKSQSRPQISSLLCSPSQCRFCQQGETIHTLYQMKRPWSSESPEKRYDNYSIPVLMNHSLYEKFSSSLVYYYTREINDIINNTRSLSLIIHKYNKEFYTATENLNKYYTLKQSQQKTPILVEYYKYHNPIPRLFMYPIAQIMNKMHDQKRKNDYWRIVRKIEDENKRNPHKPPKNIVGEKLQEVSEDFYIRQGVQVPKQQQQQQQQIQIICPQINFERVLEELDLDEGVRIERVHSTLQNKPDRQHKIVSTYKKNFQLDEVALETPLTKLIKSPSSKFTLPLNKIDSQIHQDYEQFPPKPSAQRFKQQLVESLKDPQLTNLKQEIAMLVQASTPRGQLLATPQNHSPRQSLQSPLSELQFLHPPFFQVTRLFSKNTSQSPRNKAQNTHKITRIFDPIVKKDEITKTMRQKSGSQTLRETNEPVFVFEDEEQKQFAPSKSSRVQNNKGSFLVPKSPQIISEKNRYQVKPKPSPMQKIQSYSMKKYPPTKDEVPIQKTQQIPTTTNFRGISAKNYSNRKSLHIDSVKVQPQQYSNLQMQFSQLGVQKKIIGTTEFNKKN